MVAAAAALVVAASGMATALNTAMVAGKMTATTAANIVRERDRERKELLLLFLLLLLLLLLLLSLLLTLVEKQEPTTFSTG